MEFVKCKRLNVIMLVNANVIKLNERNVGDNNAIIVLKGMKQLKIDSISFGMNIGNERALVNRKKVSNNKNILILFCQLLYSDVFFLL